MSSVSHLHNLLNSENPFKLAAPPNWWLQKLFDYDSQLVIVPSRIRMAYILARRRRFSNAMAELATLDQNMVKLSAGLDGDTLANHNLIYVRHLIGETVRKPEIFQWLADHDVTAKGGGEKVAARVEDIEADLASQKRRNMISDIEHRAGDAWRSYQARTGRRSGYSSNGSGRAKQMPITGFTPAESPAAIFTR